MSKNTHLRTTMDVSRMLAMTRTGVANGSALSASTTASSGPSMSTVLSPSMDLTANGLVAVLRLLKLVDTASGLCLFTMQWKWHPHAHAEGVDALVQSLAQFAREIDGGDVVRVHFDSHVSRSASNSVSNGSTSSISTGSMTPTQIKTIEDERRPSSVGESNGTAALEMLSHQSGQIQAVLFHDRVSEVTTQRLRHFAELVVAEFVQLYRLEIARLQPATAAFQAALTPEQTAEMVAPFASFSDVFQNELLSTL